MKEKIQVGDMVECELIPTPCKVIAILPARKDPEVFIKFYFLGKIYSDWLYEWEIDKKL